MAEPIDFTPDPTELNATSASVSCENSGDVRDACPLRRVESIDSEAVRARRVIPKHLHVRIPFQ
jgi:hypothetical protein